MIQQTALVINLAVTGHIPTADMTPRVPISPAQIADDVNRCFHAGARIFHLHARDERGRPSWRPEIFSEIISDIRSRVPEAIICVTTSGRFYSTWEERSAVLDLDGDVKPDLASLTLGSLNFIQNTSVNSPDMIGRLAEAMKERGIVPELEIFDFGLLDYAHFLISRGILQPPFVFNFLLGSLGALGASPINLALLVERLPPNAYWAAAGIGRYQAAMNNLGIAMGGHVRTGLEDNIYLDCQKKALASNEELVLRCAEVARAMGRPIASSEQARVLLGLEKRLPSSE